MDPLTAIAASGLRARIESLELVSNNIANAGTTGYKADREYYGLYNSDDAEAADFVSTMPVIERPWTDLSQGALHVTGSPLDVALSGKGFFSVNGSSGPLYTRNGNFRLDAGGKLISAEGYAVRGAGGAPIVLTPGRPVDIDRDGTITQSGAPVGRLEISDFASGSLLKQGNSYFRPADDTARPAPALNVVVEQGKLEGSNTGTAEGAVRLVSVMRQFEMLQKAVALASEMNRGSVEQVARVS